MKKLLTTIALSAIAAGAIAGDKIVIKGSDTLGAKMVPQLAEAYKEAGNEISFEIAAEGSSTAFTHLQASPSDVGMSSRNIKDSETEAFTGPISVYTRNTSSGTYKSFQEMAMQKRDYGADTQKMAGNEQIAEEVAKNGNGIGYVGLAYTSKDGIKSVLVDGIELKPENAKDYPIARSLHYYTVNGQLSEPAIKFLVWATTDKAAAEVVERVGFIPAD